MFRKKSFYLLSILLVLTLVLTGCGGDGIPGSDGGNGDQTPTTETVSISGSFTFPEDTGTGEASSTSVNSLDNGDEYQIVVENFDTGNVIENIDITFTGETKYKASGIETGQDIVINIMRKKDDSKISTFIPEVTKEDENDENVGNTNPATTILTAIVKKQKEKSDNVKFNREEIRASKNEIEEVAKNMNGDLLNDLVGDIEDDKIDPSDEMSEGINRLKDKIEAGQSTENAEKMVDFVRKSGVLIEGSANTHEKIVKDNLDLLGTGMEDFVSEFESDMRHLFTPNFINKLPTNVADKEYSLSDLDGTADEYTEELFQEDKWEWTINSGTDVIKITTNYPSMMDTGNNPETIDISNAEFEYIINSSESEKYFRGTFTITSAESKDFPVYNSEGNKLFDVTAPVDGDMTIDGDYKTSTMSENATMAITLSEDTDLNDDTGTGEQHVELDGYINLPDIFEFDGQITYDAKAKYDSNYIIQEIESIDVKADGLFTTQAPDPDPDQNNITSDQNNIIINAENIDFEILGPDGELQYIFLRGSISDEQELVKWSGELDVQFDTHTDPYNEKRLLVSEFDFMGSVNSENSEELVLNIHPVFNYNENGELISGESTIRLEQGNRYLDGEIIADSDINKVILENENHSRFYFEENDEGIIAESSYIVNANGEKIADIDSDGRIYYIDEENGGEIGSLY